MKQISHLVLQFDSMRFTKDGGGKITFEFSGDTGTVQELQKIQTWSSTGDQNFAVAISPLKAQNFSDAEIENLEY